MKLPTSKAFSKSVRPTTKMLFPQTRRKLILKAERFFFLGHFEKTKIFFRLFSKCENEVAKIRGDKKKQGGFKGNDILFLCSQPALKRYQETHQPEFLQRKEMERLIKIKKDKEV